MTNEMSITQDFRTMTLNLPTDTVTINLVVKMLKGQYTFCQSNNHNELSFNPWSDDLHVADDTNDENMEQTESIDQPTTSTGK